ncbi:MAG: right-handed parallel beta-helix repeat-containing protein, partial [Planctomycetes bacterium]|nr:right-handed parallel beta-helix repeat-containing protein [Planctomycetota bacterium]
MALLPVPEAYAVGDFMRTFATWDESAAAADGEWQIADGRWRMDDEASEGTGQAETGIEETVVRAESTPAGTPAPRATEPEANVEDAPWRVETASQRDLDNLSRFGTLSHPFGVQRLAAARALGPFWTERVHRQAEALQNRAFRATQPDSSVESASQRDPDEARVSPLSAKAKTLALRAAAKSVSRQPEPGPDGFWLTQVVPTGDAGRPFDTLEVHFSQAVQDGSFTVDDVQFTGPGGPIAPSALTQVEADKYELEFSGLTGLDAYTLVIGPDIANGSGALMDQDHDGTPGEAVQDAYTARLAANGMTLGATDTQYDGWNLVIYGNTATIDGAHAFGGLEVLGGATLTHSPATETAEYSLNLTIRDTLWVDAGANINASGRGYLPGRTIGNTTEGAAAGQAGGSYAGLGGTGARGGTPNQTYGDYANPNELGSGGGYGNVGGGLVRITAGSAQIDGSISANGGAGGWNTSGGSGGGVFLDVGALSGSGTISANGGTGIADPGGGSGGRVAMYYDTLSGFDLTRVTAYSGSAWWGNAGGVGTVYLKETGQEGLLRLDNGAMARGGITPLGLSTDTVFQAENLVLSGSTVTAWPDHAGLRMEVSNLSLLNGATLTHQATTANTEYSLLVSVNGTLAIDATSRIDVSGRGYLPGRTVGNTTRGAATWGSGGSYGGIGGMGYWAGYANVTNRVYGDYRNPDEVGSGGGAGGSGGGLARITAGAAVIDGAVLANGSAGGWNTPGGSGGGLLLNVGTLSGGGTIAANGGPGHLNGGSGSGGRVAIYDWTSMTLPADNVSAQGGTGGYGTGQDGSVFITSTDRFLLWNRMANQLFHGVERLSWSSLGLDPAAVTVDILASSAGTVRTLGTGLLANGSLDWNTTSAPDGVYELRGIVRDASGAALVEGTLHVTVNNALGWHSGQIASDETWTADRVHMVEEDVTVATGARLTIAPGAIVKFAWQTGITVADGAFLDALGTEAAPIVLTAWADDTAGGDTNLDGDNSLPQPGEWAGLGALGTGQLNLNDYAELRYIATTHTGTLLGDETWMGTFLHRVSGEVVVPTGATLIISPGAIVKFEAGAGLTVQTGATLSAQSSLAQPIIFTSIKDDRFAGDTNLDGDLTRASAGDWRSIRVDGGAGLFNHAEVFYGGNSTVSVWGAGGMLENLGTITFENGVVSESLKDGILGGGTTTIRNSLVLHNDRGVVAWGSPATIMNSTMDDNRIGVLAHGGTPTVVNSIISNSLEYGVDWDWGSYAADVRYSDVWNSGTADFHNWFGQPDPVVGVNGVISADPLYKNRDKGDYRLNYRSPAIDAGDGGVAPAADRMGAPRYDDPRTANTGLPDA